MEKDVLVRKVEEVMWCRPWSSVSGSGSFPDSPFQTAFDAIHFELGALRTRLIARVDVRRAITVKKLPG